MDNQEKKQKIKQEVEGKVFPTNHYGDVVVVEYRGNKDVEVRFVNTGNTQVVQLPNIKLGLIQDIVERERKAKERMLEKKLLVETEKQRQKDARFSAKKADKERLAKERESAKMSKFLARVGEVHTDKLGFEYTIVGRDVETKKFLVRYSATANEYSFTEQALNSNCDVYDRHSPDFEREFQFYTKMKRATWYENNRDVLIQKALNYQKENPEKANHYNRIRRGKREEAEGTHTLLETKQLLEQQGNKCACCEVSFDIAQKHLDHKMPIILGGSNYITNLQWLCDFCNLSKNGLHPDDWERYSKTDQFLERRNARLLLTT